MGRILIVEDERINRTLFKDVLTINGYETLEATTGREGVDMAMQERPDLILMDVQMPGMDGLEAVGLLKANPATSKIPTVALTGFAIKGDREKMLAGGFDDYLSKPVDIEVLLETVKAWIQPGEGKK